MAAKTTDLTRKVAPRDIARMLENGQPVVLVEDGVPFEVVEYREPTVEEVRSGAKAFRDVVLVGANGGEMPVDGYEHDRVLTVLVTPPSVGDGMHGGWGSDTYPFSVVEVNASGKTIKVQRDNFRAGEGHDYYGAQVWVTTENPFAPVLTARWSAKRGQYVLTGSHALYAGRYVHQDPSF
jgi:hypothetical protein